MTTSTRTSHPAITSSQLLAALRSRDATIRASAHRSLAFTMDPAAESQSADLRAAVVRELVGALRPADHQAIRWLIEQEIAAHESTGHGAPETLYILVAALARNADPTDALTIWRAHNATAETREGVDVEQLLRAGVERVRRSLTRLIRLIRLTREGGPRSDEATQALAWLELGVANGATDDLPAYFAWSDERYGLHIDCPTCRFTAPPSGLPTE